MFAPFALQFENIIVADFQYAFQQDYLVRIEVTLPDLYLCDCAPGYVAAVHLKPRGELFLRDIGFFTQYPYVVADCFFNVFVHNIQNLRQKFCT